MNVDKVLDADFAPVQIPFAKPEFALNPERRCPCLLLLDTSGSMSGEPINELNRGLAVLRTSLQADSLAAKRVELAMVTFGPARIASEFQHVEAFNPGQLAADGDTPMGEAIRLGLDLLEARKTEYRSNGLQYYRPWVILISDGEPTDDWRSAAMRLRTGEESKHFLLFTVGVQGANFDVLRQLSNREPKRLDGLNFTALFQWLSSSLSAVSQSAPGASLQLPPASSWAVVDV